MAVLVDYVGEKTLEMGLEGLGGSVNFGYFVARHGVRVLGVRGKAMVRAAEGEFLKKDVGVGRETGPDVLDVEWSAHDGDGVAWVSLLYELCQG